MIKRKPDVDKNDPTALRRSAQYVRMSTEHQQYSIANQSAAIALYAAAHTLHADCMYGPELSLTVTDGTVFSFCVSNRPSIETELSIDEGGQPIVLHDYSTPADGY